MVMGLPVCLTVSVFKSLQNQMHGVVALGRSNMVMDLPVCLTVLGVQAV